MLKYKKIEDDSVEERMKISLYDPYRLGASVLQRQKTKSNAIRILKANL